MIYKKNDKDFIQGIKGALLDAESKSNIISNYLAKKEFDPRELSSIEQIGSIPYVHVSVFKKFHTKLSLISEDDIALRLHSSATSGQPSTIILDKEAVKAQKGMSYQIMTEYLGTKKLPMVIYDLPPSKGNNSEIGARMSANVAYMRFASKYLFALKKIPNGKTELDVEALREFVSKHEKILHFGFTYMVYDFLTKNNVSGIFNESHNGTLIHIGGWKKLESQSVSKKVFNSLLKEKLKVDRIIDVYGFTELMGMNFPDCEFGKKHVPNNTRVLVRDPDTLELLPNGEPGVLQFLSSFPTSYFGNSILTDDIGVVYDEPCECGHTTQYFEVIGRKLKSETRGCGDILARKIESSQHSDELTIFTHQTNDLETAIDGLKEIKMPVAAIVKLIDKWAGTWMDNPKLIHLKQQGLSYLSRWCSANHLSILLDETLYGGIDSLDNFSASQKRNGQFIYSRPAGVVSHWVAGNVPLLGLLLLVQSILTKNKNIIKLSSNNLDDSFMVMLNSLKDVQVKYRQKTYCGSEIYKSLCVSKFGRNNISANKILSLTADVRVAWGGGAAMSSIKKYPTKIYTKDLLYGPRTSFIIVSQDYLNEKLNVKSTFLKIARDISSFEQRACSSPHTIFYKGNNVNAFKAQLAEALEKTEQIIPVEDDPLNYDLVEAVLANDLDSEIITSENNTWAIIENQQHQLEPPSFSRVIHVKSIENFEEIYPLIYSEVQSVGLGLKNLDKFKVAKKLAELGVTRLADLGVMTNFDNPWDKEIPLHYFVSNRVLGGPNL